MSEIRGSFKGKRLQTALLKADRETIVLAFPGFSVRSVKKRLKTGGRRVEWIYLGLDWQQRQKIARGLGSSFIRLDTAREYLRVAENIPPAHAHWMDSLNRAHGSEREWWFGAISSRNIRQSRIFHAGCFMEIFRRCCQGTGCRPQLVVVESLGLAQALAQWAQEQGLPVEIIGRSRLPLGQVVTAFYTFLRWAKFWVVCILRRLAVFAHPRAGGGPTGKKDADFLVVTNVQDQDVKPDGSFYDRYFPHLHEFLARQGRQTLVLPLFSGFKFDYFSINQRLRRSSTQFLILDEILRLTDYTAAFLYPFKALFRRLNIERFQGFPMDSVVREEQWRQDSVLGMDAALLYRFFLRAPEHWPNLKTAVVWYENRSADRAVVKGLRRAYPSLKILGGQPFLRPPNALSFFPLLSEIEAGIVPDLFLTSSAYESQLLKKFTSKPLCLSAAALRYQHLFSDEMPAPSGPRTLLVLLPFDPVEILEFLKVVVEAVPAIPEDVIILLKAHPDFGLDQVRKIFGADNWPQRFTDFCGPLSDGLKRASVVISASTSAMVEAAARGVPEIFLGVGALEGNFLASHKLDMVRECFSSPELVDAINVFLGLSEKQRQDYHDAGLRLRDLYFLPVNDETLKPYCP